MNTLNPFQIRPAHPDDLTEIVSLIRELARYEKLEHEVRANPEDLRKHLFGERPFAEAILAETEEKVVGFALFFQNYSTFRARPGIYLEDLFVRPEHRGKGIGKALLKTIGKLAVERGCGRFEWAVLDWNTPAIDFYQSLGARPMDDWTVYRLEGEALQRLADT
ncbi:MAG: GNAT family N-acetyltransferase [Isosphaeraceae bacterium]